MIAWARTTGWRHAAGLLAVAFSLFPIVFVVSAALNPVGSLSSTQLIPSAAGLGNFGDLFSKTAFPHWYLNSILIAGIAAAVGVFLSMLAAYAFSRMRFTGRRVGLVSLLLIQMFPQFLSVVTIYLIFAALGDYYPAIGLDRPWGLMLLYLGGALGVNTWLMKGFLDTVPKELDESAVIDGASHAQIFFRVTLPLVAPILAVTGLLGFIGTINEVLLANVFLHSDDAKTLAVGLYGLVAEQRNANFGMFCAGSLLTAVPTVVVFQVLQRYIVSGLTTGAVKG
ncbi:sugar ABC transporter permease [Dactylosporangium sp. CA-139114]|uniref:sugar ABC transporter permease n=1 Tax=Dactylosporangium sp. CA-139114 TaxID=3239931 RepID=UPI003D996806